MKQNVATCKNNHDISKQVKTYTSSTINPSSKHIDETVRVRNQTNEEWLYEREEQWEKECDTLF
jgi:hypothetical protein